MPTRASKENVDYDKRFKIATKDVLTTGEIELVAGLSCNKVQDLLDDKMLAGFHVPMSTHRRCPKKALFAYMTEHGMPIPKWAMATEAHVGGDAESNGVLHAKDGFGLGYELLDRSVTKITIDDTAVAGRAQNIVDQIRQACEARGYPVPAIEILGQASA